ncbi:MULTISPECIES: hypothetical protein [Deinococcus]|uniref:Uncharacterized protein n=1 Tax=Deinococcus rufus TaxID=2136097 RepID=A0ABV7ZBK4_9DEIO|nr:hypothetical protein [Deinococcus sp. AB2017081]WQE94063.1 hypothetical protein U2P90_11650 [Deinococcus sp. AB2017081]
MTIPDLHWARQHAYTGCMYYTLYALTGDVALLAPEFTADHNFARWTLAAIERGLIPETTYSDSAAWQGRELGTDALRPLPLEQWFPAVWRCPEEDGETAWALAALCVRSRRRQRSQHMVALIILWQDGWRFGVSDSTSEVDGVQWFDGEEAWLASHYATALEVHVLRPLAQAQQPWHIGEDEMPALIEAVP